MAKPFRKHFKTYCTQRWKYGQQSSALLTSEPTRGKERSAKSMLGTGKNLVIVPEEDTVKQNNINKNSFPNITLQNHNQNTHLPQLSEQQPQRYENRRILPRLIKRFGKMVHTNLHIKAHEKINVVRISILHPLSTLINGELVMD